MFASLPEDKRLSLRFQTDTFTKLGDEIVPVYFGSLNAPAVVSGEVTLEIDRECEGSDIEITYSAIAGLKAEVQSETLVYLVQEKALQRKRWTLDLDPTKTGKVGPGTYRRAVGATIDPLWPSSFNHDARGSRLCWIRYFFEVKFHAQGKMGRRVIVEKTFDVWILNSPDASPMSSLSAKPLSQKMKTKKSSLEVSFSIPAGGKVEVGQVLPVTLRVPPFESSKFQGQAPVLSECVFKLREDILGKTKNCSGFNTKIRTDLCTLPLQTQNWTIDERTTDGPSGLERVINMSLPSYPTMSPSATTFWLDVSYVLEISLKIRAQDQKEKDAETILVELPLVVVSPHHAVAPQEDQLPAYE